MKVASIIVMSIVLRFVSPQIEVDNGENIKFSWLINRNAIKYQILYGDKEKGIYTNLVEVNDPIYKNGRVYYTVKGVAKNKILYFVCRYIDHNNKPSGLSRIVKVSTFEEVDE